MPSKPKGTGEISTVKAAEAPKMFTSGSGIITIPGLRTNTVKVLIVGTAPLITHKFSEKAESMILAKHMGEASRGREKKDPEANFMAARHRLKDGGDGFPAGGFKAAIASATGKEVGFAKTVAKGALRVIPDCPATNLIRILTPHEPVMRQDVVRNESGVVDIRHRPQFWPWGMLISVDFVPDLCSAQQVLQAVAMAGFRAGIGEWRPSSPKSLSGAWGTWRLAEPVEVEAFEDGRLFETEAFQADNVASETGSEYRQAAE